MELHFLGTGSAFPSPQRSASAVALRWEGRTWLFDCGEGTQTQLMRSCLKPGQLSRIFITHLHGDHLFGLAGLLCTVSMNAPEKHHVDIYGPVGLRTYLATSLALSGSFLTFTFRVHELKVVPQQIGPGCQDTFAASEVASPPLQQNELPSRLVEPDDSLVWHLQKDERGRVRAGYLHHRVPSFSYVVQERQQPGSLDVRKVKELGVPPGPLYGKLKAGESVVTSAGNTVSPADVLGAPVRGRKVVVCGDTRDSSPLLPLAAGCDVMVHEATLCDEMEQQAVKKGHSTPGMAGRFAKECGATCLILTHFSQRYKPATSDVTPRIEEGAEVGVAELVRQAEAALGAAGTVLAAHDFFSYTVPRPKPS